MRKLIQRQLLTISILFNIASMSMAQMLATINGDVQTDFAVYSPVSVTFTPQVPAFTAPADVTSIPYYNLYQYNFHDSDRGRLSENHFTSLASQYKQMYDVYNECTWTGMPVFVTTDAVLHIYHTLFDQVLAEMETAHFLPRLLEISRAIQTESQSLLQSATTSEAQEALTRNLAFASVAVRLMGGSENDVPPLVATQVEAELALISAHDGYHVSPVLGNFSALDYSQFQVRGHYTTSEDLEKYFRAMMWYGWTILTMEPDLFGDLAYEHTLSALLMSQMLHRLTVGNETLMELWTAIYEPTTFLVGKADDPSPKDYITIAQSVYGDKFLQLSPDALNDTALLDQFMGQAQALPEPQIPNWIYGSFTTYKGFRFFGQRFIPDSYLFSRLVLPSVGGRFFPRGLDVMTILGSDRAYQHSDIVYGETANPQYVQAISDLRTEFSNLDVHDWAQNLYWNWLYTLMPLLSEKGEGYPVFMQTLAWADKELMTALASWTQLRHDTILYAKQSSSPCCIPPGPPRSYVEPNPHLYARLLSLVRFTHDGLSGFNLLSQTFTEKLQLFDTLLSFLLDISIKELENRPLTQKEYEDIYCFGKVMQHLVSSAKDPSKPWDVSADDMAIIADVHTDSNSDQCLEEGVGYPLEIFVIVNEGGFIRLTRGAIFSYYEFKQPIAQRLTDEAWREMLADKQAPDMPEWTASFFDLTREPPTLFDGSPDNLYSGEFTQVAPQTAPSRIRHIHLYQNVPNPFNPQTTIRFDLREGGHIVLAVYDLMGRRVRTLAQGLYTSGSHLVQWDGRNDRGQAASSGLYLVRLESEGQSQVKKMYLIR